MKNTFERRLRSTSIKKVTSTLYEESAFSDFDLHRKSDFVFLTYMYIKKAPLVILASIKKEPLMTLTCIEKAPLTTLTYITKTL